MFALLLSLSPAYAETFVVDTTADTIDANPGDCRCTDSSKSCSLRAAVMEANTCRDDGNIHIITLPEGEYRLTLDGGGSPDDWTTPPVQEAGSRMRSM